jgi:hypothetical protein
LTRASIKNHTSRFIAMDCRVKPGNDDGVHGGIVDAVLAWRG